VASRSENRTTAERKALGQTVETEVNVGESFEVGKHVKNPNRYFETAARFGLITVPVIIMVAFGFLKPAQFLKLANLKTAVALAAPLLGLAVGLTAPLTIRVRPIERDQRTTFGKGNLLVDWRRWDELRIAIVSDLAGVTIVGGMIGFITVGSGVKTSVVTLATGTFMAGIEFGIVHGATILTGILSTFIRIGAGRCLGTPIPTIVGLVFALTIWLRRIPVPMDGGIRPGADVVKAMALGEPVCLFERPYLWGLDVAREEGVLRVLQSLRNEVDRDLAH
jgi:hypothetical protein